MGLARLITEDHNYVKSSDGGMLPVRWMAPETLTESGVYTQASDVWSYGVCGKFIYNLTRQMSLSVHVHACVSVSVSLSLSVCVCVCVCLCVLLSLARCRIFPCTCVGRDASCALDEPRDAENESGVCTQASHVWSYGVRGKLKTQALSPFPYACARCLPLPLSLVTCVAVCVCNLFACLSLLLALVSA